MQGHVTYQREGRWCPDCLRDRVVIRAVRTADNWHSDWRCEREVMGRPHPRSRADRGE